MAMRPITESDELLNHYVPGELQEIPEANRAWFDHTEMMLVSSNPDDPVIDSYFQAHPGIDMIHGYTIVLDQGRQHNVRAAREVSQEEMSSEIEIQIGPILQTVIEPYKRWSFSLEKTEGSDISVEATCVATTFPRLWPCMSHPVEDHPAKFHTVQDVLLQLIEVESGTLRIGDRTWDLAGWQGFRDHCWGFRLPQAEGGPSAHTWLPAFFPSRKLLLMKREDDEKNEMYSFCQIFPDDGEAREYEDVELEIVGGGAGELPKQVKWQIGKGEDTHTLATGEIDPDSGTFIAGGWMGESEDEYYGPFKVEADIWDEETRVEAVKRPGLKGMARYRVRYELDGEVGYGLLACFMTNDYRAVPA